jgi:hypothetical protein
MGSKVKAKRISKGHYEYRGYKIICIGYYPPEQRVVWECVDSDGTGFGMIIRLKVVNFGLMKN